MTMSRLAKTIVVLFAIMAACAYVQAQDGLAGELDDLLGLGGDDAAPAQEAKPAEAAEKVEEAAPAAAEKVEEAVAEVAEKAEEAAPAAAEKAEEAVAEVVEKVEEAAPAAAEKAEEAVAEVVEKVEEAAPAAAEKVEEAVAEVAEKAEEAAPAAAEKVEEAVAEVAGKAEEAAPAAAEKAEEAVAEVAGKAEEAAPAAAEKAEEAKPAEAVAEKAEEKLDDLLAPAADEPKAEEKKADAAPAEKAETKLDDLLTPAEDEEEVAEVVEEKKDEPAAAVAVAENEEEAEVVEVKPEQPAAEPTPAAEQPEVAESSETPAGAAAGEDADDYAALVDEIATLERVRKQALEKHGKSSLESARKEMKDGNYTEAQRLYEEAVKFITKRPGNYEIINEAEEGVAEAIYQQARVLWKKEVMEEALQMARKAREKNHPKASQLISDIQAQIDNPPKPPRPKAVKRWKESGYLENDEDVRISLGKAREYYLTGEYDLARRELELILRSNPYNQEAVIMLKRVAERELDFASGEFNTTRSGMIADVRDKWTAKNLYAINVPEQEKVGPVKVEGKQITDPSGKTAEEVTADKMRNIEIPSINFRQANINDVIEFLQQASRDYDDPQLPPEKRGVNLILKTGQAAAATSEALPNDDPFAQASESASSGGVPPVTFKATSMNLYEVLQVITDISGLKFRIRGNIVMIMPQDMPTEDMISKTYTVLPSIEERASGIATSLSASKSDSGGFPDPSEINNDSGTGVDWKQLFSDMGVKWPTGSTITYLPSINKMRVYNTPENLIEFDKALQELNVTPRQVEIEARFVEVGQTDLDALGIEWGLTDPWEIAENRNDPMQYISVDKMGSGEALRNVYGMERSFGKVSAMAVPDNKKDTGIDDGILKIASHLTNPEIELILHAISQKSNSDLLSAPKIVTMNQQEAIIKVVTEYIYPTEYELEEYEGASGDSDNVQNVYPAVQPSTFEMREVGVILQVAPEVSEDGQMIVLQLNPQIISEPDWEDYGFEYPTGGRNADGQMETYHIAMRQPLFKVRSVNTKVTIYNGATVVMGGMITEQRREVEDKIPFLGDIPLIGRLFRSTYEMSEKRNLLIFVTARMVDPAGRTVNNESSNVESNH